MKEQVKGIIYDFKNAGWTVQKVEQELKFSNGTLGKVMNDKAGMSDFKFSKLLELHQATFKKIPTVTEGLKEQIEENSLPENEEKILSEREDNFENKLSELVEENREEMNKIANDIIETGIGITKSDEKGFVKRVYPMSEEGLRVQEQAKIHERIKTLEHELKNPPKTAIIGVKTWIKTRQKELSELKSKM